MKPSSLESKTVRPGLGNYSFYHSDRHPLQARSITTKTNRSGRISKKVLVLAIITMVAIATLMHRNDNSSKSLNASPQSTSSSKSSTASSSRRQPAVTAVATNHCAGNDLSKFVRISITDRHLWACEAKKQLYDSPVISGMEKYAATLTPTGTFHIYAKKQDTVLTGSDQTGSWNDPVAYWMPYLDNENGTYGFHDASWRANKDFGMIDPYSDKASHGCVELPTATSAWLYNWTEVGTTVTVES